MPVGTGPSTIHAEINDAPWGLTTVTHNADDSGSDQPSLDELITLQEAAELSGLSASHLRLLVRRGDVWGVKMGHYWLTTAQAVQEYLTRDRRPGPKAKKSRD